MQVAGLNHYPSHSSMLQSLGGTVSNNGARTRGELEMKIQQQDRVLKEIRETSPIGQTGSMQKRRTRGEKQVSI